MRAQYPPDTEPSSFTAQPKAPAFFLAKWNRQLHSACSRTPDDFFKPQELAGNVRREAGAFGWAVNEERDSSGTKTFASKN
jgi:hypothetical protein